MGAGGLDTLVTSAHHCPVDFLQEGLAIQSIIHTRNHTPPNERNNPQVVQLVTKPIDLRRISGLQPYVFDMPKNFMRQRNHTSGE